MSDPAPQPAGNPGKGECGPDFIVIKASATSGTLKTRPDIDEQVKRILDDTRIPPPKYV